jgi:F0F1-type ATP synthase delta subunit
MSKIPRTRLAAAVAATTLEDGISPQYVREVAAYLLSEGRSNELDSLLRDVQADWASRQYLEVIAASAFPLTPAVREDIARTVKKIHPEAKHIIVTEVHDPSVIGSVRLSLPDQQLDLSVQAKLNKFKQLTAPGKE